MNLLNVTRGGVVVRRLLLISTLGIVVLLYLASCSIEPEFSDESESGSTTGLGPNIVWQKTFGGSDDDVAYSVQQTVDGGYIVAGYTKSTDGDVERNHGMYDFWVLKLDNSGNVEWKKTFGGSNVDMVYSIQQTRDGGYIAAGYTSSKDGDIKENHGFDDFWIVKLNEDGDIEWEKTYGGSNTDIAYSIKQTSDDGYIVVGETYSYEGKKDIWALKLDENGSVEWQQLYGSSYNNNTLAPVDDIPYSVQQTSDGGYIIVGESESEDGYADIFVMKLDKDGIDEWQKFYEGPYDDRAYSVQQTSDGGYIVVGETVSTEYGDTDLFVMKLDEDGNKEWQKVYGGSDDDTAHYVQEVDSGYIIAGETWSEDNGIENHGGGDFWLLKLDRDGNIIWQKTYGGSLSEVAYSVQQTSDGGYIMVGYSTSNDEGIKNHGKMDFWVVKVGW